MRRTRGTRRRLIYSRLRLRLRLQLLTIQIPTGSRNTREGRGLLKMRKNEMQFRGDFGRDYDRTFEKDDNDDKKDAYDLVRPPAFPFDGDTISTLGSREGPAPPSPVISSTSSTSSM